MHTIKMTSQYCTPHILDCDRDLDRDCDVDDDSCSPRRVASRRAAATRGAILAGARGDTLGLGLSRPLPLSRGRKKARMSSSGRIERAIGVDGVDGFWGAADS